MVSLDGLTDSFHCQENSQWFVVIIICEVIGEEPSTDKMWGCGKGGWGHQTKHCESKDIIMMDTHTHTHTHNAQL